MKACKWAGLIHAGDYKYSIYSHMVTAPTPTTPTPFVRREGGVCVEGKEVTPHGRRSMADGAWQTEHGRRSVADGAWQTEGNRHNQQHAP